MLNFGCLSLVRLYRGGMSSAAQQPLTAKTMNSTKGQPFDTEVNEWSELLTNEQEVAVHPVEVPLIGPYTTSLQDQAWKMPQKYLTSNGNRYGSGVTPPSPPTRDWLEMRQQSGEGLPVRSQRNDILSQATSVSARVVETRPSPTLPQPLQLSTNASAIPPHPPPKKFHPASSNLKSAPAPPIPTTSNRGKPSVLNEQLGPSKPPTEPRPNSTLPSERVPSNNKRNNTLQQSDKQVK